MMDDRRTSAGGRMPTLYIPHGAGPCFFMDWSPSNFWTPLADFLKGVAATLPTSPRAILLVSAHWESAAFQVGNGAAPALIYDYYGFPPHTYELTYPAPGDPALALRVLELFGQAGIAAAGDPTRGFDHGMFIPLKLMFPDADIPVVQLSLRADRDAAAHVAAGRALERLREEGVLIVGSGMSFHNMSVLRDPGRIAQAVVGAAAFDLWLTATVEGDPSQRDRALANWEDAPSAHVAHPPHGEEHLLPLMVAAGAGGQDGGRSVFLGADMILPLSAFRFG